MKQSTRATTLAEPLARPLVRTLALALLCTPLARAHDDDHDHGRVVPPGAAFTTLVTTPLAVEGPAGDRQGRLHTTGRSPGAGLPCPVWRIALASVTPVLVGQVPAPNATGQCSNPSGFAFGANGALFIAESDKVYTLQPDAAAPPLATVYASGVPGANGLAFDAAGRLWTGDGTTGLGRVWSISTAGVVTGVLRVPPVANPAGVGRSALTLPPASAQPLVANGIAFTPSSDMLVADTARGALWRARFDLE